MFFEFIGSWIVAGFFSAIGWNIADETVNKPYLDPWIAKKIDNKNTDTKPQPPTEESK